MVTEGSDRIGSDLGQQHDNNELSDLKLEDNIQTDLPDTSPHSPHPHTRPTRQVAKVSGFLHRSQHLELSNF